MPLELAVILPTLNEQENIRPLIKRLDDALGDVPWEAILVDDNSSDGTADTARSLALEDARIRVIQRIGRRGLASAVIEGICATAAPFVAVMDADHQHDPALLRPMLDVVRTGDVDIAVASRFLPDSSTEGLVESRRLASRLANQLAQGLMGVSLNDPMSGFFLMHSDRFRSLAPRLSGIGFKILLDILATSPEPLRVKEIPLEFAQRRSGTSKLDHTIMFEFLVGLYEKSFGRVIPVRYALFGTVGALGVIVHMAVLALLYRAFGEGFAFSQALATLVAMSFNFWLNNWLTYRDIRLKSPGALLRGWIGFCASCSVGALANVALAALLQARGVSWVVAALAGIIVASVWNYALSSRFVWGRY